MNGSEYSPLWEIGQGRNLAGQRGENVAWFAFSLSLSILFVPYYYDNFQEPLEDQLDHSSLSRGLKVPFSVFEVKEDSDGESHDDGNDTR